MALRHAPQINVPSALHRARRASLALLAGLGFATGLGIGCATSDQMTPAEKELQIVQANKGKPAVCKPGIVEPCYHGPEGTAGRGICVEGTRSCSPEGFWSDCTKEVKPKQESCNRIDDDCDGIVDNSFERDGALCWRGNGACRSQGKWACSADGTKSECNAPIIKPSEEVCDNVDNDCDGKIDDGDVKGTGVECATGRAGVCAKGTKRCAGGIIKCVPNIAPSIEICNKLDDDCNNNVDDNCISAEDAKKLGK